MITTFNYPLPDELYVEGISGKNIGSFTYDGPDTIIVLLDQFGGILDIDPCVTQDTDQNMVKQIDPKKDPAAAYMVSHYFVDSIPHEYIYEDVEMENGDIYKNPLNPSLLEAYELFYNFDSEEWELRQIIKEQTDFAVITAEERKEYILRYFNKYSFGEEIEQKIQEYLLELQNIIDNPVLIKTWKYVNIPRRNVPKIPIVIASEFAKIPENEV